MTNFYILKENSNAYFYSKKKIAIYIASSFEEFDDNEDIDKLTDYYDPFDYDCLADVM
tara:strand:+ start:104 stop:277 length:174 start_codon:yes stop_codon:yes gene_type:complete